MDEEVKDIEDMTREEFLEMPAAEKPEEWKGLSGREIVELVRESHSISQHPRRQ